MGAPSDIILGLDVGTTAAKASLFSLDGVLRLTASREYPLLNPVPGWHVQDPHAVARGVLEAMADAVARVDAARIVGISISTAMHGLLGLDRDLKPVTELLTWADSRAWKQAEVLNEHSTGRTSTTRAAPPPTPCPPS